MGAIRKTLSVSTLGLIDWRSDKERIAASTRKTAHAAKKQNRLLREANELQRAERAASSAPPAPAAPAAWYSDPTGNARLRYWNGERWTDDTSGEAGE